MGYQYFCQASGIIYLLLPDLFIWGRFLSPRPRLFVLRRWKKTRETTLRLLSMGNRPQFTVRKTQKQTVFLIGDRFRHSLPIVREDKKPQACWRCCRGYHCNKVLPTRVMWRVKHGKLGGKLVPSSSCRDTVDYLTKLLMLSIAQTCFVAECRLTLHLVLLSIDP